MRRIGPKMLNGTADRVSLQSSPVKVSTSPIRASPSPVRASPSPVRAPTSPLKSSLSTTGRQRSPRRCQFAAPVEDARDKCGTSWLCRRGAGTEEPELERTSTPGPSASLPQGCEETAPPPKNCFRLVMLGWVWINSSLIFHQIIFRVIYISGNLYRHDYKYVIKHWYL